MCSEAKHIMNMRALKHFTLATGVASALLAGAPALAQDCQVSLSQPNIDFGGILMPGNRDHAPNGQHALDSRVAQLDASCSNPAQLVLTVRGSVQGQQFRFAERGQVSVQLGGALLDGQRVDLAVLNATDGSAEVPRETLAVSPGARVVPMRNGQPTSGAVLSMRVEVKPQVPYEELRTRDVKNLETTLSFHIEGR